MELEPNQLLNSAGGIVIAYLGFRFLTETVVKQNEKVLELLETIIKALKIQKGGKK